MFVHSVRVKMLPLNAPLTVFQIYTKETPTSASEIRKKSNK